MITSLLALLARRLGLLEVHEPPLPVVVVRTGLRQDHLTELVEWRELALDPADVEADFAAWAVEVGVR